MGTATDLTADRVDFLRDALSRRLAGRPAVRRSVMSILNDISDGWSNRPQGMTLESFDRLNSALVSPLEALLSLDVMQAEFAADQLVNAWAKVGPTIVWVG